MHDGPCTLFYILTDVYGLYSSKTTYILTHFVLLTLTCYMLTWLSALMDGFGLLFPSCQNFAHKMSNSNACYTYFPPYKLYVLKMDVKALVLISTSLLNLN